MITVTHKPSGQQRTFDDAMLERICVEVCGGGCNEAQVRNAMIARSAVEETGKFENRLALVEQTK